MDVNTPLPGAVSLRGTALPQPHRTAVGSGAGHAAATASLRGTAAPVELDGPTDGPDVVLSTGVRIRRKRVGAARVSPAELHQAIRGVQLLPVQHQLLLARAGITIELLPLAHLEQVAGTTEPVLGATAVQQDASGLWAPTRIRIAVRSPLAAQNGANGIGEVTQHEIGHAIAVMASQDRSEETATRYAQRY